MTESASLNISTVPIHPDDSNVEFVLEECRTCYQQGSWVRIVRDDSGRMTSYSEWGADHEKNTKHKNYYVYSLSRHHAKIFRL